MKAGIDSRLSGSGRDQRVSRVLVIDDDASVLNVLRIGLRVEGFDVVTAANGREALDLLGLEVVDVVLADLMMPVMDGMAFLRAVREELGLSVPVVVLTGVDRDEVAADLEACGASAVLHKPARVDSLADVLRGIGGGEQAAEGGER